MAPLPLVAACLSLASSSCADAREPIHLKVGIETLDLSLTEDGWAFAGLTGKEGQGWDSLCLAASCPSVRPGSMLKEIAGAPVGLASQEQLEEMVRDVSGPTVLTFQVDGKSSQVRIRTAGETLSRQITGAPARKIFLSAACETGPCEVFDWAARGVEIEKDDRGFVTTKADTPPWGGIATGTRFLMINDRLASSYASVAELSRAKDGKYSYEVQTAEGKRIESFYFTQADEPRSGDEDVVRVPDAFLSFVKSRSGWAARLDVTENACPGIQQGDLLVGAQGKDVSVATTRAELKALIGSSSNEWKFKLNRAGQITTVPVAVLAVKKAQVLSLRQYLGPDCFVRKCERIRWEDLGLEVRAGRDGCMVTANAKRSWALGSLRVGDRITAIQSEMLQANDECGAPIELSNTDVVLLSFEHNDGSSGRVELKFE